MKIKGFPEKNWHRIDIAHNKLGKITYKEKDYYIAGTYFEKINERKVVKILGEDICELDDGYLWVTIIPMEENYAMTIKFDNNSNLIHFYFDITKENFLDDKNAPYFKDLYLDVIFDNNGRIDLLDRDELDEALNDGDITDEEYNFAIKEAEYIKSILPENKENLLKVANRWREFFNKYFEKYKESYKLDINLKDNRGNIINKKNQVKKYIKPGIRVKIVLKKDQKTGILTEGIVKNILTNSNVHHRGIKVMLEDGSVGRVQEIIE